MSTTLSLQCERPLLRWVICDLRYPDRGFTGISSDPPARNNTAEFWYNSVTKIAVVLVVQTTATFPATAAAQTTKRCALAVND